MATWSEWADWAAAEWTISPSVPKEIKHLRTRITAAYGVVTIEAAFACILALFVANFLSARLRCYFATSAARKRPLLAPLASFVHRINLWRRQNWLPLTLTLWTLGLCYVVLCDTRHDLTFLVKRLGRVAVALLPPLYFLSLKPTPFPESLYLQVLPLHKWLGRVVVLLLIGHAALYLRIYIVTGKLHKLTSTANLCGIAALALFIAVGVSSLPSIRRRFYAWFYTIHYVTAWVTMGLVALHAVPSATYYVAACVAILAFQGIYRLRHTAHSKLLVQFISPTLYLVTIPKMRLPKSMHNFTPGAHIRMSNSLYSPASWLESSHPYTVASLPDEPCLQLVIRKSKFPIKLRKDYAVYGPFRSLSSPFMRAAESGQITRALFVTGGSGIAFGAPLLRYLLNLGVEAKLLWAIRDPRDASVLRQIGLQDAVEDGRIEIYFTRESRIRRRLSMASLLESQLYKELNDDEYLDVAIDDLCCLESPMSYRDVEAAYSESDTESETEAVIGSNSHSSGSNVEGSEDDSYSDGTVTNSARHYHDKIAPTVPVRNDSSTENSPLLSADEPTQSYHAVASTSSRPHGKRPRYLDSLDEYAHVMYNSRPVLNIRLKAWLCGLATNTDECCCVDQLGQVSAEARDGAWVVSSGSHKLVNDTKCWAKDNSFNFYEEEFNL